MNLYLDMSVNEIDPEGLVSESTFRIPSYRFILYGNVSSQGKIMEIKVAARNGVNEQAWLLTRRKGIRVIRNLKVTVE